MKSTFVLTAAIVALSVLSIGTIRSQERPPRAPGDIEAAKRAKLDGIVVIVNGPADLRAVEEAIRVINGLPLVDNAGNPIPFGRWGGLGFVPGGFGRQLGGPPGGFLPGAFPDRGGALIFDGKLPGLGAK